jgi:hypothetical protein
LEDHLELLRCHYNFLRPHRALKFGPEVRTPAMQAGLAKKRLAFRDIFLSIPKFLRLLLIKVKSVLVRQVYSTVQEDCVISIAAQQHRIAEAPAVSKPTAPLCLPTRSNGPIVGKPSK